MDTQLNSRVSGALLGAGVALGWLFHDVSLAMLSKEPSLALRLLPAAAVPILVGCLLGALVGLSRILMGTMLALSAAAGLAIKLLNPPLIDGLAYLPIALLIAGGAASLGHRVALDEVGPRLSVALAAGAGGAGAWMFVRVLRAGYSRGPQIMMFEGLLLVCVIGSLAWSWRSRNARVQSFGIFALLFPLFLAMYLSLPDRAPRPMLVKTEVESQSAGPNLILVTLDTLRADHLGSYGYERDTSPKLDAFASGSTLFEDARSTSSWTLPGHASILTGLMPIQHGAAHRRKSIEGVKEPARPLYDGVGTLADRLARNGYETAGIVSNSAYLQRKYGLGRGFAYYDDRAGAKFVRPFSLVQFFGLLPELANLGYRDARTMVELADTWLAQRPAGKPFFLFVNFMDPHFPYLAPGAFRGTFESGALADALKPSPDQVVNLYDEEIRHLDHYLGRWLSSLEESGLLESTAIVITSDHGEAFGEHGFWAHGRTLYEEMIRVPLIVRTPGQTAGNRVSGAINGAQVYGLALESVGLENDKPQPSSRLIGDWFQADKYIASRQAEPIDRDLFSWIDGSIKYHASSKGSVTAYDLTVDPGEQVPLELSEDELAPLLEFAKNWWAAHPPLDDGASTADDPEALERLRALGYID